MQPTCPPALPFVRHPHEESVANYFFVFMFTNSFIPTLPNFLLWTEENTQASGLGADALAVRGVSERPLLMLTEMMETMMGGVRTIGMGDEETHAGWGQ
jgi:hypothetical protein